MRRRRVDAVIAGAVCLVLLSGCHRVESPDVGVGGSVATTATTTDVPNVAGVEPTEREHIPADSLLCWSPVLQGGQPLTVRVADQAAPIIQMTVPDDWEIGVGEPLPLTGPDGMSGSVNLAVTELGPGGAFVDYADKLRQAHPDSTVDVLPAPFCGYSSQLVVGVLSGIDGRAQFADRITHIWTNVHDYLVVVHLQGPEGAADFEDAKAVLMQQFTVTIP